MRRRLARGLRLRTAPATCLLVVLSGCSGADGGQQVSTGQHDRVDRRSQSVGVPAEALRVRAEHVVDGDTVIVSGAGAGGDGRGVGRRGEVTVRLLEIDAPESRGRDVPVQCFARRAARALGRLLPTGSMARVVADRDPTDRYGRTLLYVWNADGVFVNERLVARGFARAVLFRPNDRYIEVVRSAERTAKRGRRGLWGSCGYFGQPASLVPAAAGR